VFQKMHGPGTERVVRHLAGAGVTTVYIQCDLEPQNTIPALCDVVVCPAQEMADWLLAQGARRVECIPDPAETVWPSPARTRHVGRGLRVCWVGHGDNFHTLDPIRAILHEEEFRDLELVTISNHKDADVPWSLDAVREVVPTCDLAVVPTADGASYRVKSSNRVVLFMAAGVPVLAGNLRSYREVIEHGSTGMLAADPEAYRAAFRLLRDPQVRARMAHLAYERCLESFTLDRIIERWITLFTSLAAASNVGSAVPHRSCHLMGVLKAHSALRLSTQCRDLYRRDFAFDVLREGIGLAMRHPSPLLPRDLLNLGRPLIWAAKERAIRTPVLAPAYRLARRCWHLARG
jgi:hypothetical protein